MDDKNIAEIVKGTIASITVRFPDLSDAQLRQLREAEQQGQKRSGLFDAIDAELRGRAESAAERGTDDDGKASGEAEQGFVPGLSDALADDQQSSEPMVSQSEVNRQLAERDATHVAALDAQRREFESWLSAANEAKRADPAPLPNGKGDFATLVLTRGAAVAFIDDQHHEVPGLPELTFRPGDFRASGSLLVLTKEVELPTSLVETTVAGAVLLADDDDEIESAIAVAMLVQPVGAGGGKLVKLPGGTLAFGTR